MTGTRLTNNSAVRSQFCIAERQLIITMLKTVVEVLSNVLNDNVEVVLHDMLHPEASVIAIVNGHVTGRNIGDSILAGPKDDEGFAAAYKDASSTGTQNSVITNYSTITKSGMTLSSSTAIFRDSDGEPFAALCFNSDMMIPEMAHTWLSRMLGKETRLVPPTENYKPAKVGNLMEDTIGKTLGKLGKPVGLLTKDEKVNAVAVMQKDGLFVVRGGVNRAAKALGVTRFTIYNYLDELKKRNSTD